MKGIYMGLIKPFFQAGLKIVELPKNEPDNLNSI